MRGRVYIRRAYTWSNTSVKEKVGLSVGGCTRGGGGGLIGGEIRYSVCLLESLITFLW